MKNMENNNETAVEKRQRIADEVFLIIESSGRDGLKELANKIMFSEDLAPDDLANTIKEEGMSGWSQIAYYIQEKGSKESLTIIANALRNSEGNLSASETKSNPEEVEKDSEDVEENDLETIDGITKEIKRLSEEEDRMNNLKNKDSEVWKNMDEIQKTIDKLIRKGRVVMYGEKIAQDFEKIETISKDLSDINLSIRNLDRDYETIEEFRKDGETKDKKLTEILEKRQELVLKQDSLTKQYENLQETIKTAVEEYKKNKEEKDNTTTSPVEETEADPVAENPETEGDSQEEVDFKEPTEENLEIEVDPKEVEENLETEEDNLEGSTQETSETEASPKTESEEFPGQETSSGKTPGSGSEEENYPEESTQQEVASEEADQEKIDLKQITINIYLKARKLDQGVYVPKGSFEEEKDKAKEKRVLSHEEAIEKASLETGLSEKEVEEIINEYNNVSKETFETTSSNEEVKKNPETNEEQDTIRRKKLAEDVAAILEKYPKYYDVETWEAITKNYLFHPENQILDRIKKEGLYGWLEVASYLKEKGYEDEKGYITDMLEDLEPSKRNAEGNTEETPETKTPEQESSSEEDSETEDNPEETLDWLREQLNRREANPEEVEESPIEFDTEEVSSETPRQEKAREVQEKKESIRRMFFWNRITDKMKIAYNQIRADWKEDKSDTIKAKVDNLNENIRSLNNIKNKTEMIKNKLSSNSYFRGGIVNARLRNIDRKIAKIETQRDLVQAKYEKAYDQMTVFTRERDVIANRFVEYYNEKMAPMERELKKLEVIKNSFDLECSVTTARHNSVLRILEGLEKENLEAEVAMTEAGFSKREIRKTTKENIRMITETKKIIAHEKEKLQIKRNKIQKETDIANNKAEPYRVRQQIFVNIINRKPGSEKIKLEKEKNQTKEFDLWEDTYESEVKELPIIDVVDKWNKYLVKKGGGDREQIDLNSFEQETRIRSNDQFAVEDIKRILENYYKRNKVVPNILNKDFGDFITKI